MVIITATFSLFAGILATIAHSRNNYQSIKSISYFILGLVAVILSMPHFQVDGNEHTLLPSALIAIISIHFFLGEITRNKTQLWWNFIPLLSSASVFLIPDLESVNFNGFNIDNTTDIFLIALISSAVPFLTHLAKLGIGNLIIRFGSIKWAEDEENYLESLVSYAFIGGMAALGSFLLGNFGLLLAGSFYLSATLIARNKVGLQNDIISSASGSIFLLVLVPILLEQGGFTSLDFTKGEVLEGAFVAGFMVIFYELLINLARHNTGMWKFFFGSLALIIPIVAITLLGLAYTQLERLGGVLSLAGVLTSMAILSVTFTMFKRSTFIALQLVAVGLSILLLPYIKPVEIKSSIDLASLGIEEENETTAQDSNSNSTKALEPKGKDLKNALGEWSIDQDASQIPFELGPPNGRTKGALEKVKGTVVFTAELESCSIDVTMPVASLTTYNSMRDEHLMASDYFHEEKYPTFKFEAEGLVKEGDGYIAKGTFSMLGEKKPLEVKLKLLGVGEKDGDKKAVLWGTSQLDRTQYGMEPSAKIGNIVDFTFEIQLNHEF